MASRHEPPACATPPTSGALAQINQRSVVCRQAAFVIVRFAISLSLYLFERTMLEPIMLLGIGFLAACLLTLALAPLVHERAVRLTTRRHRDATPTSVAEMQAEKDGLRAQFAMSIRRLEIAVEETRTKAADRHCEIGKKSAEIHRLKIEIGKVTALILGLQARERMRGSVTRRIVKLLAYMFARSRRGKARALLIPTSRQSDLRQWGAVRLGLGVAYPKQGCQRPKAKWAVSASASGLIVSFLLLGLSSDTHDQQGRKLGLLMRGDRPSAGQSGVTKASAWELRKAEVGAAKEEKAGARRHADAAKAEAEAVTQRTTKSIIIFRGGHRTTRSGQF
jgi:hypothetical protein